MTMVVVDIVVKVVARSTHRKVVQHPRRVIETKLTCNARAHVRIAARTAELLLVPRSLLQCKLPRVERHCGCQCDARKVRVKR